MWKILVIGAAVVLTAYIAYGPAVARFVGN
jgi:hypothetical protein